MKDAFDIAVAGGGPAGCVAAIRLARLGYRTALVAARRHQPAVEGFSARVIEGLGAAGCGKALDSIGPEVRRDATWNGEHSAANSESVVDRVCFDAALLDDARDAGVQVIVGRAGRLHRDRQGWTVRVRRTGGNGGGDGLCVRARFLVEARGRAAPGLGDGGQRGPATAALARLFAGVPRRARTAVAGFAGGWAWFATTGNGDAVVTLLIPGEPGALPRRGVLADYFGERLGECSEAREWLGDGRPVGPVRARNAGMVLAANPITDGAIRVGDAAVAIDPLSGHGVFEALGSALAAGPVVNTLLARAGDAEAARAFYTERCQGSFLRHARTGRAFYEEESRWPDAPFWKERRAWPDREPPHAPPDSAPPVIALRPVIDGDCVTRREVIVTADHPRGIWLVDGVRLVPLLQLLTEDSGHGGASIEDAAARLACSLDRAATAASWLRARRLIA